VDYQGMARSEAFATYVDAAAELQGVDPSALTRPERLAFWINVYNALVVHGTAVLGAPAGLLGRLKFFASLRYEIGGQVYSCDDIEHGVLRNNAPSPASLGALLGLPGGLLQPRTFAPRDPRAAQAVAPVDPRIHFALVCGAKSCPPIRVYSAANIEQGLQDAAEAFCEGEVAVSGDRVTLSKIFKWYGGDFGATQPQMLRAVAAFLRPEARAQLTELVGRGAARVHFKEYDWAVNAKE